MRNQYIYNLIAQGEHQQLDFKFEISDAAKIARSLVAFANTRGGKLLIGVKDNGVIKGVSSDEEYFMIQNAAQRFCRPEISFNSKEWVLEGKKVLEIDVPLSENLPHRAPDHGSNYKAYVRHLDENLVANGVQMKIWKKLKLNSNIRVTYTETEESLLRYLKKETSITINQFREIASITKHKAESLLADFILLEIISMEIGDSGAIFVLKEAKQ